MKAGLRAAGFGVLLLDACAADVVSVGAWIESRPGPAPSLDAAAQQPVRDAATTPSSDAAKDAGPAFVLEPAGPYVEAELGELSPGFQVGLDDTASGGKFLESLEDAPTGDAPGDARARYLLDVRKDGEYILWGRMHGPDYRHNRFWFQVDGGPWVLWRLSTGEVWFWDDLHDDISYREPLRFRLSKGVHELMLANARSGVQLDRIYFTADGDQPPGNDTPCKPPHTIEIAGECLPSCGSLKGTACGAALCEGAPLLDAYDCDICCRL